jgi:uroporphyrinogen decarboxylase
MTGKQLILDAMENKITGRTPYVPFVGVHAAALLGMGAEEFLRSTDNIVAGMSKSVELYKPDGIPVVFDLQIEAEVLGSSLVWSEDNPPAVSSHPLMGDTKLADLPVFDATKGRIPLVLDVTRRLRAKYPDLALYGLITGPFTLALHLMGPEIFMAMYDDPANVQEGLHPCSRMRHSLPRSTTQHYCRIRDGQG